MKNARGRAKGARWKGRRAKEGVWPRKTWRHVEERKAVEFLVREVGFFSIATLLN